MQKYRNYSNTCDNTYKSLNHMINCSKFNLGADIETNPGPVFIEPSKTIHAPYSQGNVDVFGTNAGRQCVAMSLCALIYKYTETSINGPDDLIVIMGIGNELYSALSKLSKHTYLLLTELPNMLTILDTHYQLQFSETYTGNLHAVTIDENIPYVMPFACSLQNLLQENYDLFLVTIACNTVSVYIMPNGSLKIFDSHSRDSFGMAHPHGTCVLLEVTSVHHLTEYFKICYRGDVLFELKGVKITTAVANTSNDTSNAKSSELVCNEVSVTFAELCMIYIYSICFSTIKACTYWDDSTLDAVAENAMLFYKTSINMGNEFISECLPQRLNVLDANIDIVYTAKQQGMLSVSNKNLLVSLISQNAPKNTGFLLWFSDCCLACIFQHENSGTTYCLVAYNGLLKKMRFEKCSTPKCLIDKLYEFSMKQGKCEDVLYNVLFLSCSHKLSKTERQKIVRKHKCSRHKRTILEKKRTDYANLQPVQKKQHLEKCRRITKSIYKSMDPLNKKALLRSKAIKYESMDPLNKKALLETCAKNYSSMGRCKKNEILNNQTEKRKSKQTGLDSCISTFKTKITDGPFFVCSVCQRLLYRKSVVLLQKDQYDGMANLFTNIQSFDQKEYICKTCHSKVSKGITPCMSMKYQMNGYL